MYTIKMEPVNNNNGIHVPQKPNNIIGRKIIGATECGTWNIFYNEDTGQKRIYLATPIISINIIMKTKSI